MTTRRKWPAISQVFTSNGGSGGVVIVAGTFGFFIDQKITINSTTQPKLNLIVREVLSKTQIKVEKKANNNIKNLAIDLSAYLVADTATIAAVSQKMPTKTAEDIIQEAFERGPTDAHRVINVDRLGNPITTENPLQVELSDGSINIGTVNAELEVQLSHQDNVPDAGDVADSVRIGGGVANETVEAPNEAGRVRLATLNQKELPSQRPIKYKILPFENGGSNDMAVNGSVTPVVFELAPLPGENWFVERITVIMRDSGNLGLGDFGSGAALTNGLLIEFSSQGSIINAPVVKTNQDLLDGSDIFNTISQFSGSNILVYLFIFREPIALDGDQGDFIRFTVRDNLTGIQILSAALKKWEVA